MISWASLIMGWDGSKCRSLGQILENSCIYYMDHLFCQIFFKLAQYVSLDNISVQCNNGLGWVGLECRSLGQILETSFLHSRGNIFGHFFSNMVRMFVLMISRSSWIMGWVGSKSRSNLRKSCLHSGATCFAQSSSNLIRMFVLMISHLRYIMGWVGSKSRSLDQILKKKCLLSRGHIFGPICTKLGQIVRFDDI